MIRRKRNRKDFDDWFRQQSKFRLLMAICIVIGIIYVVFGFGYDEDYYEDVREELKLAAQICENSLDYVMENPDRLKLGKSNLKNIRVNGKEVDLEHVKYPKVIFLESGFHNINRDEAVRDLYCEVIDPRTSGRKFYYKYNDRIWVDKVRFRR